MHASDVDEAGRLTEEQMVEALERRTTIGIALGIIMVRLQLDRDQAFVALCRASSRQNRKVCVLAEELVATMQLPAELQGPYRRRRIGEQKADAAVAS